MDDLQRERQRQRLERLQRQTKEKRQTEREQTEARRTLWLEAYRLERQDEQEAPLYEVLAANLKLAGPSLAAIRPRVIIHLRYVTARIENDLVSPYQIDKKDRPMFQKRLDRVREILKLLDPDPQRPCASCGKPFLPGRRDAVTCSPACRQRIYRRRVTDREAQRHIRNVAADA